MKLKIKQGTTSKLMRLFVQDSSATDGAGLTGLAYNASGLTAYYLPEGDATTTAITLAAGTTGTYATGAWSEVDATNMPGVYELGLPDAVVDATSEGSVVVMLKGATNMAPVLCEIELDAVAYRDATDFGITALVRLLTMLEADGGVYRYTTNALEQAPGGAASNPWSSLLTDNTVAGTFGARFQEGPRYQNTDADIKYIRQNDSYDGTANALLTWTVTTDYTGWAGTFVITHRVTGDTLATATVTVASATSLTVSLSTADTAFATLTNAQDFGPHPYSIQLVSGGSERTAASGAAVITEDT